MKPSPYMLIWAYRQSASSAQLPANMSQNSEPATLIILETSLKPTTAKVYHSLKDIGLWITV